MFARLGRGGARSAGRVSAQVGAAAGTGSRRFGAGGHGDGHHHGPHVPEFHDKLAKFCLVSAFFWIMYRAKENKGQLFGWYQPWLHEHEHTHIHFAAAGDCGDNMPTVEEEHNEEEEEEEEE